MDIADLLRQSGGFDAIARELGVSQSQATQGAEALLPAILGGFKKQAQDGGGLAGLGGLLGQLGGGGLLDNVLSNQPTDVRQGDNVLGQIFGSRDVSRTVAQNAASQTGLDAGLLKKMLPMLAMLVAGYMARQGGGAAAAPAGDGLGGLGNVLGGLLGGGRAPGTTPAGGLGGLGALIDMNGDGNALDDILRLAGKGMR
jgi:hypothetical protein